MKVRLRLDSRPVLKKSKAVPVAPAVDAPTFDPMSLLWTRLMSVETAARFLDCTAWHVEDLCRSGEIVAFKEGKHWAISRLVLEEYVDRRTKEAG